MRILELAIFLCAAPAACMVTAPAFAQGGSDDYPAKLVTITVPFDAGSSHDSMLRPYLQSIFESTGKRFQLVFRPGAGTTLGTAVVARSAADGYTILSVSPAIAITPSVYPDLPYDNIKDFAPISLLSKQAFLLVVNSSMPYKNVAEYIAYAKAHPGELNWSSSGAGSATHLPGEFLHYLTKTKVTFVHYKTGSQRLIDLMAGRVHVSMASFPNAMEHIKAGRMRALAVTTNKRVPDWPEMPTIEEQGVPGYDFSSWLGLLAPARTPQAIIDKLYGWFLSASKDPNVSKPKADGNILVGSTPEELRQHLVRETEQWRKLIRETGMKVEGR